MKKIRRLESSFYIVPQQFLKHKLEQGNITSRSKKRCYSVANELKHPEP
jgi:hypothetical protein